MKRVVALAVVSGVVLSGCGGSSTGDATGTVKDAFAALAKGDGVTFCKSLTASAQKKVVAGADDDQVGKSCGEILSENFKSVDADQKKLLQDPKLSTTVQGSIATVKVERGSTLELIKTGDRWLISSGIDS